MKAQRSQTKMIRNYAVIQIWKEGAGFGQKKLPDNPPLFEKVFWFQSRKAALHFYEYEPQGQTKRDGECDRLLCKVQRRIRDTR